MIVSVSFSTLSKKLALNDIDTRSTASVRINSSYNNCTYYCFSGVVSFQPGRESLFRTYTTSKLEDVIIVVW